MRTRNESRVRAGDDRQPGDDPRQAMDSAMYLLKFRGRSEGELAQRLKRKGFSPAVIERTVNRLRELNLLDDMALARQWTENRRRAGQGEFRIRQVLRQRGFSRDTADKALSEKTLGKGDEVARAWQTLTRRLKQMKSLEPKTAYRRLGGFLARRGFSSEVVHDVLEKYFASRRLDSPES